MSAVAFDTLKLARDLRERGKLTTEQAEGVAEALSTAFRDEIATKADVQAVSSDVRATEERLDTKIDTVEERLSTKIDTVEERLNAKFESLRADIARRDDRLTIKLGGMLVVAVAVMASLVKLL